MPISADRWPIGWAFPPSQRADDLTRPSHGLQKAAVRWRRGSQRRGPAHSGPISAVRPGHVTRCHLFQPPPPQQVHTTPARGGPWNNLICILTACKLNPSQSTGTTLRFFRHFGDGHDPFELNEIVMKL